jgi:cytochrome c-type biogenesis protein CcmE
VDLTPRTVSELDGPVTRPPRRRRVGAGIILAVVLAGVAVVLFQSLASATFEFCNADQIGVTKGCADGKRVRLQGTVDAGSIKPGVPLRFTVSYNRATVPVVYGGGEPGGIFREGIPVVVEGRYENNVFVGTRIINKHTEQYREANPDRVPSDVP